MRLCYLHPVPLVTARGKTACPQCGMLYPTLPAVPTKPDAAQLPGGRGLSSSRFTPAGAFLSQNPAQDREQTGGLSGAVKHKVATATAGISSPELCRRSPYTPSAPLAGRADAAPGRFIFPTSRARHQSTGDVR